MQPVASDFIPFCPEEVRALEYVEHLPGGTWAESNVFLKKSPIPGWWHNSNNPALKGIMDVLSFWHVRIGVIRKGIQTGGTQALHVLLGREARYSNGNDNALAIMADEKSVKKHGVNRIRPLFEGSPELAAIMSPDPDDTNLLSMRLLSGFRVDVGWATSEVSLASESYRVIIFDEISKYPSHENIDEAKGRATTYEETKRLWFVSSPDLDGSDPMQAEESACDVHMTFKPVCPGCGESQEMVWENFDWPKRQDGSDPPGNEIRRHRSARYICRACGSPWDNDAKNKAVLLAMESEPYSGWVPDNEIPNFGSVSFHYPGWLSRFVSIDECVAKWLEAQKELKTTGKDAKMKKWTNTIAGNYYKREIKGAVQEDAILRLRDTRPMGVVPCDADALEISIDTQDRGFWYRIRAWRYGLELASWLIKSGYVESRTPDDFSALDFVLTAEYPDENGEPHRIMAGIIDTQGHRTSEVYAWCRRTGVLAAAGAPGRKTQPVTVSRIDRFPGNGHPIPGGLSLYNIDTHYHKDMLSNKLLIDPTDPGAFLLHSGHTLDQIRAGETHQQEHNLKDYAKQMCSEYRDDRGLWQCPKNKSNHLWDCESNGLALVNWLGWQHAVSDKRDKVQQQSRHNQPPADNRPGWFNNR